MATAAPPSTRLTSGIVDSTVVEGIDALLRPLWLGRPGPSATAQLRRLLVDGCYRVAAVALAGRTCGQALFRLRVVDAQTGGRPGWRTSLVWWAARQPPTVLLLPVLASARLDEAAKRLEEAKPEVEALERRFEGDRPAFYRAVGDLYKARGIDPFRRCGSVFAAGLLAIAYNWVLSAGMLLRRDRRSLCDRLAGIVVVPEQPRT